MRIRILGTRECLEIATPEALRLIKNGVALPLPTHPTENALRTTITSETARGKGSPRWH